MLQSPNKKNIKNLSTLIGDTQTKLDQRSEPNIYFYRHCLRIPFNIEDKDISLEVNSRGLVVCSVGKKYSRQGNHSFGDPQMWAKYGLGLGSKNFENLIGPIKHV